MRPRTLIRLSVAALVVLVGGFLLLHGRISSGEARSAANTSNRSHLATIQRVNTNLIAGSTLPDKRQAPDFTLTDQNGKQLDLNEMRGHPVLLTFMDATCTQECPITAQYLNWTKQFLGAQDTSEIDWIAVSVNPSNTAAQAKAFIAKYQLAVPLRFGLGTQRRLSAIWQAYHVTVIPAAQNNGDTGHTVVLYLLDKQGREREIVDQGWDPKQVAHDLRVLLNEQE